MTAKFGMIGLGVMGENLALNIEEHGFPVAVWNLETEKVFRLTAPLKTPATRTLRLLSSRLVVWWTLPSVK